MTHTEQPYLASRHRLSRADSLVPALPPSTAQPHDHIPGRVAMPLLDQPRARDSPTRHAKRAPRQLRSPSRQAAHLPPPVRLRYTTFSRSRPAVALHLDSRSPTTTLVSNRVVTVFWRLSRTSYTASPSPTTAPLLVRLPGASSGAHACRARGAQTALLISDYSRTLGSARILRLQPRTRNGSATTVIRMARRWSRLGSGRIRRRRPLRARVNPSLASTTRPVARTTTTAAHATHPTASALDIDWRIHVARRSPEAHRTPPSCAPHSRTVPSSIVHRTYHAGGAPTPTHEQDADVNARAPTPSDGRAISLPASAAGAARESSLAHAHVEYDAEGAGADTSAQMRRVGGACATRGPAQATAAQAAGSRCTAPSAFAGHLAVRVGSGCGCGARLCASPTRAAVD
ncbi:hypothetical protein C8R45DRAFT_932984 [Mycena sanguinolenta]|nr:hypothetical protein C8R45DRAFT_932984 [Mycena sanguinolenta]